jgi:hypothetical protein
MNRSGYWGIVDSSPDGRGSHFTQCPLAVSISLRNYGHWLLFQDKPSWQVFPSYKECLCPSWCQRWLGVALKSHSAPLCGPWVETGRVAHCTTFCSVHISTAASNIRFQIKWLELSWNTLLNLSTTECVSWLLSEFSSFRLSLYCVFTWWQSVLAIQLNST